MQRGRGTTSTSPWAGGGESRFRCPVEPLKEAGEVERAIFHCPVIRGEGRNTVLAGVRNRDSPCKLLYSSFRNAPSVAREGIKDQLFWAFQGLRGPNWDRNSCFRKSKKVWKWVSGHPEWGRSCYGLRSFRLAICENSRNLRERLGGPGKWP